MPRRSSTSVRVSYPTYDTEEVVRLIREQVESLGRLLPLKMVAVFGSYARGNYTAASDIDLLVVYSGRTRKDAYNIVKKAAPLPRVEPHVYSEEEYRQNQKVVDRMLRGARIVFEMSEAGESVPRVR